MYHPVRHNDKSPSLMLRYNVTSSKQDHPTARMIYRKRKRRRLICNNFRYLQKFQGPSWRCRGVWWPRRVWVTLYIEFQVLNSLLLIFWRVSRSFWILLWSSWRHLSFPRNPWMQFAWQGKGKIMISRAGMAQWWECFPPTNEPQVWFQPDIICVLRSLLGLALLRGRFSGFSGIVPSTKTNSSKFQFDNYDNFSV